MDNSVVRRLMLFTSADVADKRTVPDEFLTTFWAVDLIMGHRVNHDSEVGA